MNRYPRDALVAFATSLLQHAGLERDKADVTADGLVTADAMGHSTHGLALLPEYLQEIAAGSMTRTGEPTIVTDREAAQVWDGRRLPGLWLTKHALDAAASRATRLGTASVVIRRSHHIGALAAFLPRHAENGHMALVTCSDPSAAQVAPFGSAEPLLTPDPLAAVIPTEDNLILIDISSSITTAAMTTRLAAEGRRYPAAWALDASGAPSEDPSVLGGQPPGSLLPIGGLDHGHKGFALALLIEALTQGLSGYGRADGETRWGASVYVQVWDPSFYGGLGSFQRQTSWLAAACRACQPQNPTKPVRLPGQLALQNLGTALIHGVPLHDSIMPPLKDVALARAITLLHRSKSQHDRPELALDLLDRRLDRIGVRHVGRHRTRLPALCPDFARRRVRPLRIARQQPEIAATRGKRAGRRSAQPALAPVTTTVVLTTPSRSSPHPSRNR